jgi:uncharacterized delta-60 repeat protein
MRTGTDKRTRGARASAVLAVAVAVIAAMLIAGATTAAAAPGDLDPAYGTGGKTTVDFGGDDLVEASVLQSDGSLVTVGDTAPGTGGDDMAVSRLTPSGAPDPAFGSGGKATIDFTGGDDKALAVALQPDGKIIVAGQTTGGLGGEQFAVARLTSVGALDPTFGSGGETTVDFGGSQEGATGALVTPSGQIILTGFANPGATGLDFAAARLNANGSLDTTFGSAGKTTVDFGGDDDGEAATLTPDGHILIAGSTTASGGGDVAVTQLNPDGSLDTTFGTRGTATVDFGGSDLASSILRDSAGRIVVAGQTSAGTGGGDFAVARLTAAGALDPSFGTAGKTLVDFSGIDRAFAAALAPDGGVVVVGGSNITGAGTYAVARLTAAGALDSAFASGGKATVDFGDGQGDVARAVVLQPDGKIVVSGTEGNFNFGVARLLGEVAGTGTGPGTGTPGGGTTPITFPPNPPACRGKVTALIGGSWRCVKSGPPIDDGLALAASEVPGFRHTGQGAGPASTALAGAFRAAALKHATRTGAAFSRGDGRRLTSASVTMRSVGTARAALRHLSRGFKRLGQVGDQAFISVKTSKPKAKPKSKPKTPTGSVQATVVFRVKRAIGVIRLTVPRKSGNNASGAAVGYAQTLAARLRRVIALTAWDRTIDQIRPDGTFSPTVALHAFALQYGALPGVKVASGAAGGPFEGTMAMGMVDRVWNRLSAAQHRVIDEKLDAPHDASSPAAAIAAAKPQLTLSQKYTTLAQKYQAIYLSKIPGASLLEIRAYTADTPLFTKNDEDAYADAQPLNIKGQWGAGTPVQCRIRVAPSLTQEGAQFQALVMAHEAFHCIQFSILPAWDQDSDWIIEGMADWAETEVNPASAQLDPETYEEYLETPGVPLEIRTYDAMGFWHRLDEVEGDGSLWAKVPAILKAPNDGAAFAAAGGNDTTFLQQWASGTRRSGGGGSAWNQMKPFQLSASTVKTPAEEIDDDATVIAWPFSTQLANVSADGDNPLVELEPQGGQLRAAIAQGGSDLGTIDGTTWMCTDNNCVCPPDEQGDIPAHSNTNGSFVLAEDGGEELGAAIVTYHSLDEFCNPDDNPGGGSSGGSGGSGGIGVYSPGENGVQKLGVMNQGSCQVTGGAFEATASGGGYTMHVHVPGATKPNVLYSIPSGSSSSYVTVNGYSSTAALKTGVGGVKFINITVGREHRLRVSLGYDALFKGTAELILVPEKGGLVC